MHYNIALGDKKNLFFYFKPVENGDEIQFLISVGYE